MATPRLHHLEMLTEFSSGEGRRGQQTFHVRVRMP